MPRRQQRPGWLWSEPTSGAKGRIGGEVAANAGPDTPVSLAGRPPGSPWRPRTSSHLVLAGLFAVSILLIRRARTSWLIFAFVIASMFVAALGLGIDASDALYLMIASLSGGLTVFAISQLRRASMRERGAGARLAQLTSARERE